MSSICSSTARRAAAGLEGPRPSARRARRGWAGARATSTGCAAASAGRSPSCRRAPAAAEAEAAAPSREGAATAPPAAQCSTLVTEVMGDLHTSPGASRSSPSARSPSAARTSLAPAVRSGKASARRSSAPVPSAPRGREELRGLFGAVKCGPLQKRGQGAVARWKTRWFVLHQDELAYYSRGLAAAPPRFVGAASRATLRLHKPPQGATARTMTTRNLSWAFGDGHAVFLRAPADSLKLWIDACEERRMPVQRNFSATD
mmetsp:Transcript_8165/g.25524  ORF Transcript_8165/g.25524 Transcript_8165/m.25524 type:complete len:260 (+) Transcript_8165:286-1065(+)